MLQSLLDRIYHLPPVLLIVAGVPAAVLFLFWLCLPIVIMRSLGAVEREIRSMNRRVLFLCDLLTEVTHAASEQEEEPEPPPSKRKK